MTTKRKKKPSHTLTMLWVWICSVPAFLFAQAWVGTLPPDAVGYGITFPLSVIVISVGTATCSFLGLEYGNSFMSATSLPKGQGGVERLQLFKVIAYVWFGYLLLVVALQMVSRAVFPQTEIATFAGAIMVAYVSGNKAVKIATNMGPQGQPVSPSPQSHTQTPLAAESGQDASVGAQEEPEGR